MAYVCLISSLHRGRTRGRPAPFFLSLMYIALDARLAAKTPVYDHAGVLLFFASKGCVRELLERDDIETIGTRRRIRGVQFVIPDRSVAGPRRRQVAEPHRSESYTNVRGVWAIDRIPESFHWHFAGVLRSCLIEA